MYIAKSESAVVLSDVFIGEAVVSTYLNASCGVD